MVEAARVSKPRAGVYYITQGVEFNINYISKVENLLPEIYATEIVTMNFHMDDSRGKHRYNITLGRDI